MNERIRKLAEQAGLSHMPSNYPDMADLYKGADYELAKFAELIVGECVDICYNHPARMPSNNWQGITVPLDIAQRLEEHFRS